MKWLEVLETVVKFTPSQVDDAVLFLGSELLDALADDEENSLTKDEANKLKQKLKK